MLRRGLTGSDLRQYLLELCAPLRWSLWALSFSILGAHLLGAGRQAPKVLYVFRAVPAPLTVSLCPSQVCQGSFGCALGLTWGSG